MKRAIPAHYNAAATAQSLVGSSSNGKRQKTSPKNFTNFAPDLLRKDLFPTANKPPSLKGLLDSGLYNPLTIASFWKYATSPPSNDTKIFFKDTPVTPTTPTTHNSPVLSPLKESNDLCIANNESEDEEEEEEDGLLALISDLKG